MSVAVCLLEDAIPERYKKTRLVYNFVDEADQLMRLKNNC